MEYSRVYTVRSARNLLFPTETFTYFYVIITFLWKYLFFDNRLLKISQLHVVYWSAQITLTISSLIFLMYNEIV